MKKSLTLVLILNFFLTGCASLSHVPLSKDNSQSIKTVQINPDIKKPDTMYEFGSGTQVGMMLGPIGGAVSGVMNHNKAISTQAFAEKNNIDIKKIVYQRWATELNNKSHFKPSAKADALLTTDIVLYGISIPNGFSTSYVPVLKLKAKLVRNNQVIWQDSGEVSILFSDMPKYKMDEILKDPKKLYVMWDKASEKIIDDMITDMNK